MSNGKTVLVTGSNKGIGFEICRQLGKKGFHVIVSGRNEKKTAEACRQLQSASISCEMLVMDVSSSQRIADAALLFGKQKKKMDVLINNAGIIVKGDRLLSEQPEEILFETIQTNSLGPLEVSKAFLPFLSNGSRIINISSGGGSMTDDIGGWSPAYCISKSMLNAITRHLAYEFSSQKISVNAVCPGWVQTDMGGRSATRPVEKGAETPVWLASEADGTLTGKFFRDKREIPW